ncbi:ANTAR domain-containing protein [Amycolatopsis acidicola]|uniref:ANTAR domain-containing protein n=1 Tax=Amycolatopsis acidicola TaxID=2596893 RepID=A0A5N0UTJ4_9PSEU|nr:PAS and ANTAR domain-containing protein [Amycolatopsis acidicola]KAA9152769.1 ANTAR domain-containing protein [Amycolatopsis acidicola]
MSDTLDPSAAGPPPALHRVVAGRPHTIGSFRFHFADQRWEWSDEVALLHGYAPGSVHPTTELLLSHKHPDDRVAVAENLAAAVRDGTAFCSRHRIIDTTGTEHHVLVVADRLFDDTGATVGTAGHYIDLGPDLAEQRRQIFSEALPDVVDARAVIEQAKGALMLVYGITAEHAFAVLKWRSQETNSKLRDLAAKLTAALTALGGGPLQQRTQFDHLLLTIHECPLPPDGESRLDPGRGG